jgi:hypothetical protein
MSCQMIEIGSIKLTIEDLQFSIPSAAAALPHQDCSVFTAEQKRDLGHQSDQLHFLAARAMDYWLRVIWWKTGFHQIYRHRGTVSWGFDGGGLINVAKGTEFYTPPISRLVVGFARLIVHSNH